MVVIKAEDKYAARAIFDRYGAKMITSELNIKGEQLVIIESGPSAALLEIYIAYGIKEINGKPI